MKEDVTNSKMMVFLFSIFITGAFLFFSIPSFPSKEKISNLLKRVNSYHYEEPIKDEESIDEMEQEND